MVLVHDQDTLQRIHLIYGATASGKSAYALTLAKKLGGVIINADSQQLYRELRMLTARPSVEDEAAVPHRLYGVLPADKKTSVGHWLKLAKMEIDWALAEGLAPIVVGGTGLYLKALTQGMAAIPDIPADVTAQSARDMEAMGKQAFFERLQAVDAASAASIGAHNTQRLIRAYSVWLGSGKPLSFWQAQGNQPLYAPEQFAHHPIELERDTLYKRCDARVITMIEQGALEEVKALGTPIPQTLQGVIGVQELRAVLDGEASLGLMIPKIQQRTRNYAKRQLTWFRHQQF